MPEHAQTCTGADLREEVKKAEMQSAPRSPMSPEGSTGEWYRTFGLLTRSTAQEAPAPTHHF